MVHMPQLGVRPPQPSENWPQQPELMPAAAQVCAHVSGVQAGLPHMPGVPPPPQVAGGVHVPQSGVRPPQPSAC